MEREIRAYAKAYPQEAAEFTRRMKGECRLTSTRKQKSSLLNCRLTRENRQP